jgi:hypothetical protein
MLKKLIAVAIMSTVAFSYPISIGHYKAMGGEIEGYYGHYTAINTIDGNGWFVKGKRFKGVKLRQGRDYIVFFNTKSTKTVKDDVIVKIVEYKSR